VRLGLTLIPNEIPSCRTFSGFRCDGCECEYGRPYSLPLHVLINLRLLGKRPSHVIVIRSPASLVQTLALLSIWTLLLPWLALSATPAPQLFKKSGRHALLVDGSPYLVLGAQIGNSSAWPEVLSEVWTAIEALHVNTAEAPLYSEQMEPEQGHFDWTNVDDLDRRNTFERYAARADLHESRRFRPLISMTKTAQSRFADEMTATG
jgi:hypothetical protein